MSSYSYIWRFWGNRIIKNNNVCIKISIKQTSSTNYANGKQLEQSQDDRKWKIPFVSVSRYVNQMFSFWGFWIFCFQFVSFGCFGFFGALIISVLNSIGKISRRRSWWLFAQALSLELQLSRCFHGMKKELHVAINIITQNFKGCRSSFYRHYGCPASESRLIIKISCQ